MSQNHSLPDQPELDSPMLRHADSAQAMNDIGRRLGSLLQVGDVVGLQGPLGAGKTTLTQGIAQGMEVPANRHVASPTFALVNEHVGRIKLTHADFYRLRNEAELVELGLDESFEQGATVIEWIDLFPNAVPPDHLFITIALTNNARTLTITAKGPRSTQLLRSL